MSTIPPEKIEEIKAVADIVEVISDHVKLKRAGSGFTGLCPFHNEKSPSFHVTPRLGIFKCFGCGKGGDVYNFMMEMEGVSFAEAVRSLAERYNIMLPEEQDVSELDPNYHLKEGVFHALRFAGVFFHEMLQQGPGAEAAQHYLKDRGFTRETIRKYGLGWAPDDWQALYKRAKSAGIKEQYLFEAGLIKPSDQGKEPYDTFRGRVMFPIFNASGKVIAFGGRVLGKSDTAKYLNSPQTIVYNKSESLYGIQVAKNEIRKEEEAILVEGYTDVLTMHQAGIKNVVSTSGTALTPDQLRILHRYGEALLLIYDADDAGQNAMLRGLDSALAEGLDVRLLRLPDGEDPDSFVKQFGKASFLEYKREKSSDFLTFIIRRAKASPDWENPHRKKKWISRILKMIAVIPDNVVAENCILQLSQLARIGDRVLFDELGIIKAELRSEAGKEKAREQVREERRKQQAIADQPPPPMSFQEEDSFPSYPEDMPAQETLPVAPKPKKPARRFPYEKEIIRLMLEYGKEMIEYIGAQISPNYFEDEELKAFATDMFERFSAGKEVSVAHYIKREHPYPSLVGEVMVEMYSVSEKAFAKGHIKKQKDSDPYLSAMSSLRPLVIRSYERYVEFLREQYLQVDETQKIQLNAELTKALEARTRFATLALEELFMPPPQAQESES